VKVVFSTRDWEDYLWWQQQDRKLLKRISVLIQDVTRTGNEGIGKPEPLKHGFQGYWSRRINDEHRLIHKSLAMTSISRLAVTTTTDVRIVAAEGASRCRIRGNIDHHGRRRVRQKALIIGFKAQ
jgi:toxin YoeB